MFKDVLNNWSVSGSRWKLEPSRIILLPSQNLYRLAAKMPKPIRTVLLAIFIAMSFASAAVADPFDDARAAYESGEYSTALRLYLFGTLADQGYAFAQFRLGVMYAEGRGVPDDSAEAAKWYRRAADQGHADAQLYLSVLYDVGSGVPQDHVQALMWSILAAGNSQALDTENRNIIDESPSIIGDKMTPEQIAEARKLAREWRPK